MFSPDHAQCGPVTQYLREEEQELLNPMPHEDHESEKGNPRTDKLGYFSDSEHSEESASIVVKEQVGDLLSVKSSSDYLTSDTEPQIGYETEPSGMLSKMEVKAMVKEEWER